MTILKSFKQKKIFYQNSFIFAVIVYFFNSVGNVSQGVFIKYYQEKLDMGLYEFMTLRCIIEIIILFPFCIKHLMHFTKNLHIVLFVAGLYACDMLLFHRGLKTVSVNTGSLILLLVPVWIVVLSRIILKEKKFNIINALFLIVCLIGVLFTMQKEIELSGFNSGYIFLLLDAFIIPLGLIMQKKYQDVRPVVYAIFTNAIMLALCGYGLSGFHLPTISIENLKGAFVVACFDIMEVACVYIAYKMTEPALLQPVRFTRIFISMLLSLIILNEKVLLYQIIGATIIIIANIGSIVYSKMKQE